MPVSTVLFERQSTVFQVGNSSDHISKFHLRGAFYELHQLLTHRDLIPFNSTVIDVGANIGNHTLFYARHTRATRVYPFEPNPTALEMLRANVAANPDLPAVIDTTHVGLALGSQPSVLQIGQQPINNLGGVVLVEDPKGSIDCVSLDSLTVLGNLSFVKVDVEGMEMEVLHGARETIAKWRPTLAIEVRSHQLGKLTDWRLRHAYQIAAAFRDYMQCWNFVLVPNL